MSELILTQDQQNAYSAFRAFIANPDQREFVLSGYAGTGKSTLVKKLLADLPDVLEVTRLLLNKKQGDTPEILLAATTNKAAENLSQIVQEEVVTIHKALGLRVVYNPSSRTSSLARSGKEIDGENKILFIDEASFLDTELLNKVRHTYAESKVVYIGDPAQLLAPKASSSPVFGVGLPEACLTQVVRQAEDNPIQDLCTILRTAVTTKQFGGFTPDGTTVKHLTREDFDKEVQAEFSRVDWKDNHSKVLAWTNATVIGYNEALKEQRTGTPEFREGDYAINNSYVQLGKKGLKNNELVQITGIRPVKMMEDADEDRTETILLEGWMVDLNHTHTAFLPKDRSVAKKIPYDVTRHWVQPPEKWVDLREAYSCTINKSQGSTYGKVFIDLDDVNKCRNMDTLTRLLYVGASRARESVIFTGGT